jgi:histidinol-phosphatase (PHP family)
MIANYHSHTWRCNHAEDTEREYVEAAVARGIKTLGFADHAPYFFDGDYYSGFRMKREQYRDYADTLKALRQEYADRIDIFIGAEMEYYPKYFEKTLDFMNEIGLDYIIMGQHYMDHTESWHAYKETEDEAVLARYVDVVLEGAGTGAYTYIAHPDIILFKGDERLYKKEMTRLCQKAKETDTPLEINLSGIKYNLHYPDERFWKIAGKIGSPVTFGRDAHDSTALLDPDPVTIAKSIVKRYKLNYIGRPKLIPIN